MVDIYNQFKDFKSFEVIFKDDGENLQKIFANVIRIENNYLVIIANNENNNNKFAKEGDELKLYIYTENGIYTSSSQVLKRTKGVLQTEYHIAYPARSKHSQRREYFRANIQVPFKMEIYVDENYYNHYTLTGFTKNICGKGMCFLTNKPFVEYNEIEVELEFSDKKIKTSAELVYTQNVYINNRPLFVHAFTFSDITQKNIDYIVKKCFLYQLDLKKRPI